MLFALLRDEVSYRHISVAGTHQSKYIYTYSRKNSILMLESQPCLHKLTALEVGYEINTNTGAKKK